MGSKPAADGILTGWELCLRLVLLALNVLVVFSITLGICIMAVGLDGVTSQIRRAPQNTTQTTLQHTAQAKQPAKQPLSRQEHSPSSTRTTTGGSELSREISVEGIHQLMTDSAQQIAELAGGKPIVLTTLSPWATTGWGKLGGRIVTELFRRGWFPVFQAIAPFEASGLPEDLRPLFDANVKNGLVDYLYKSATRPTLR